LLELDQAHRKLWKENKELLNRHEHVCLELKVLKDEKESIVKERNSLSVALKSSNKDLEHSIEGFEKEAKFYKIELEKLTKFKAERDAELKAIKKAEKKSRQRLIKEAIEKTKEEVDLTTNAKLKEQQKSNAVENTQKKFLNPWKWSQRQIPPKMLNQKPLKLTHLNLMIRNIYCFLKSLKTGQRNKRKMLMTTTSSFTFRNL
jgi:hypothetical protein